MPWISPKFSSKELFRRGPQPQKPIILPSTMATTVFEQRLFLKILMLDSSVMFFKKLSGRSPVYVSNQAL